jgi:uncharacterized protein
MSNTQAHSDMLVSGVCIGNFEHLRTTMDGWVPERQGAASRRIGSAKFSSAALIVLLAVMLAEWSTFAGEALALPPLTTVSGNPRLPGKFVWADLVTDDVAAAQKFYSGMFGWTLRNYSGYVIAANDERPLCGMLQKARPEGSGAQPRWFGYISVANVAKAERAVINGGGKVLAPRQVFPGRGEQAVFADSEGAVFGAIKSKSGDPEDFLADPGDWIWIQLLSRDARQAGEFYRSVTGYEVVENTASARPDDYVLISKGFARAAALTIPKQHTQVKPSWLPFVRVKSVAESMEKAKQLGGKTLIEAGPEIPQGRAAVLIDPTGAAIGIMEWSEEKLTGKEKQ